MAGYKVIAHETVTVVIGARGSHKLDHALHMQVIELWVTENKAFDKLLDKFKVDARRARTGGSRGRKQEYPAQGVEPTRPNVK